MFQKYAGKAKEPNVERINMRVTKEYVFFYSGIFSQWYKSKFTVDKIDYNCCEQYMMAQKALLFQDLDLYKRIMATNSPFYQKKLGRQVKNFDKSKWEKVCRDIVYEANYAKFSQNPNLYLELEKTKQKILVEASPYDKIWGIGLDEFNTEANDPKNWLGTNWLGEALTKVRIDLIGE